MDIHKFIRLSRPLVFEDLDWREAARAGLSEDEKSILTYFADIEGQTIFYMREVLKTHATREPDTLAFVTLWNYEEFFHGYAIARLLEACGVSLGHDRLARVRMSAQLAAKVEDAMQMAISALMPRTFMALYMSWGASQEILTLRGYEYIAKNTQNPVLRELCSRIALQERRHFAWYFNSARERLAGSLLSQKVVRALFERFWTPVGMGVKSKEQVAALISGLFPGPALFEVMERNDRKLATLPGMGGFDVMQRFAWSMQPLLRAGTTAPPRNQHARLSSASSAPGSLA